MPNFTHFDKHRTVLSKFLLQQVKRMKKEYADLPQITAAVSYLEQCVVSGKLVRGCLLLATIEHEGKINPHECSYLNLAAGIELVHTGLLIHDDVMDQDEIRRGNPSAYTWFQQQFHPTTIVQPHRMGESLAVCLGDICFFYAMRLFIEAQHLNPTISTDSLTFLTDEYVHVGLGQSQDVIHGHSTVDASIDEIFTVYTYKTARYTLTTPMGLALHAVGSNSTTIAQIDAISEKIGIIFQLRDDYLNLFGNGSKTGKTIGSDIRENKQTLYRHLLLQKNNTDAITTVFGNPDATTDMIQRVIDEMHASGVVSAVDTRMQQLADEVKSLVSECACSTQLRTFMLELMQYLRTREK